MKILMKGSTGDLIPIPIEQEETFRELNKRIEKKHRMRMDFPNIQDQKEIELDKNIFTYLSECNQETAVGSHISSQKSTDKTYDLNLQLSKEELSEEYPDKMHIEQVLQIMPEEYQLVRLDSELREEFCEEIKEGTRRSEETKVTVQIENSDIKLALLSENYEKPKNEEILNFSNVIFEPNNDVSSQLLCRLCATQENNMIHMFAQNIIYKDIMEKIEHCLPIVVKKTDNLPKQVCHSCLNKLELCHQFRKTVAEAERQLFMLGREMCNGPEKTERHPETLRMYCKQDTDTTPQENQGTLERRCHKNADNNSSIIIPKVFRDSDRSVNNSVNLSDSQPSSERLFFEKRCENNSQIDCSACSLSTEDLNINNSNQLHASDSIVELGSEKKIPKNQINKNLNNTTNGRTDKYQSDNGVTNIFAGEQGVEDARFPKLSIDCPKIKCRICGDAFQTVKKCYIHSSMHASKNYYPCSLCNRSFTNEQECHEHNNTEHNQAKKIERRAATHVCNECGKKFVTEARLQFHQIYHNSDTRPCYCKKCDKVMASESSLYQHMLTVHRQYKEYCCDVCGKQFRAHAQLSAHQRKHKDERPFECTICEKRFYSNDILRRHKKLHLPDKPYQCDQCGKRFDRSNTLTKHLLRHQVEAGESTICHICNNCKEVFVDVVIAKIHSQNCATISEGDTENKILELNLTETYRCEYCEKCYTEIKFMKNHKSCHSEPSPYVCTICDTTYATYNQATAHKTAHKKSSKITTVIKNELVIPKYFVCEFCEKRFLHFTNMNIHRRSCSNGKIWTCRYCGAVFENARELSRHKKGEASNDTWLCNKCNNSFGSECAFEIHKKTHSNVLTEKKTFSCLHCGKKFSQKANLTIHIRSHTGERPYSCDLCDKAYKIKMERDNHQRTHSGEKPFKCSICEKAFANTARLREHTRFHSDKRPYHCSLCNQSFKKANARNVHMTIHTGEKPYQCDICGTHFRRIGDMRKHKRTQHR